ncbi:acyl carrier protein [Micromonospora sp. NBC_01638]|uniref:acyl carrier protein n=1 Tax=Micromonospora sp. NBC_01638 TaxID=2975982 RepID=UPI00386B04D4|nr:acyl carrier protein [Micromonospora sp. NBC_01638]
MLAEDLVVEVITDLLDLPGTTLAAGTPLVAVDGWDSVNALRVLVYLERETGRPLDYERFAAAATVGDLAELVDRTGAGTPR